jgi:hypothetical protein
MGKWVHISVIGKIGILRNFSLYTAKIAFFDHTIDNYRLALSWASVNPCFEKRVASARIQACLSTWVPNKQTNKQQQTT